MICRWGVFSCCVSVVKFIVSMLVWMIVSVFIVVVCLCSVGIRLVFSLIVVRWLVVVSRGRVSVFLFGLIFIMVLLLCGVMVLMM